MPKKRPEPPNLTTKILEQIRDGIDNTRAELVAAIGETNDRLDTLNGRVDALDRRLVDTELRLGTHLAEVMAALEDIRDDLKAGFARDQAINDLDERVTALEKAARQ